MNNTELARRAVACKHWRWIDGMYLTADVWYACSDTMQADFIRDPATIGCLHHLACEAYNAFQIRVQVSVAPDMSGRDHASWTAVDARGSILARGGFRTTSRVDLMADGLVSALEAAP
jgi:hypothetical protein